MTNAAGKKKKRDDKQRSEQQEKDREEKSRRARAHAQASKPASLPRPIPIPLASPPPNNADRAPSLLAGTAFPHSTRASSTIPPHYSPVSPPTAPAPPRSPSPAAHTLIPAPPFVSIPDVSTSYGGDTPISSVYDALPLGTSPRPSDADAALAPLADTPTFPIPFRWSDEPHTATIYVAEVDNSVPAPRDFSALRSESPHPWSTIRRRNHRLLPRCRIQRKFPRLFPRRILTPLPAVVHAVREDLTPLLPRHILFTNHGLTVPNPVLTPNNLGRADEPVPVLTLPRHVPRPWDPYYFMPNEFSTAEKSLPGETFYGVVQSGLALVCAREYPWIDLARRDISEIVWGAHPPDELDEREDVLNLLPPDQLVFLMVLVQICRLEPDFTGFVEPAIADFVNAWLHHCWSIG
ncbi:hypothetical protein B0H11DRAFT_2129197 [Mycena galericulata]|nr:hypothetical protein B0H11DRAFT_2129197 [Mycena galericulata]